LQGFPIDALVPVPLHPRRLREREFNQAALLAEHLSRRVSLPVCDALQRFRYTGTQTALDRRGRRQNLRNAFALRQNVDVSDLNLLLVDDVLTTGATLDACAAVLLEHGAACVRALTLARG
jgi:ComF family protein